MNVRWKGKETIETGVFVTLAVSLLFMCVVTRGNPEAFLVDDNRMQWYPVMERAYEELGSTGTICCYDLYQMKGMSIAKQGYYGVMNPFMLLSYIVAEILPGHVPMISVYIGLMVVLGNLLCYLLFRRFGCGQRMALLMTATYSTAGCFWAFHYWYYVFNNYLIVPLLIYVFIRCKKGISVYCGCGIVLAMSMYMGNVQYTFYHYVTFGILCAAMVCFKEYRYVKILFANAVVGLSLSFPVVLLVLQASGDFQKYRDFFENPVFFYSLLIHSVIPQGILHRLGKGISFIDSSVMYRRDNMVLYTGIVTVWLFIYLIYMVSRCVSRVGKYRSLRKLTKDCKAAYDRAVVWSHERKTIAGIVAALFFLLSVMSGGIAARFLYIMPVVQNFRHLFKTIFVAEPLAVMVFAWILARMTEHKRLRSVTVLLTIVFVCLGVFNACDEVRVTGSLYESGDARSYIEEKAYASEAVKNAQMDCKNYRTVTFLRFPWINDEVFNISENLSRNFPTTLSVFSLAGYENAVSDQRMESFDAIYSDKDFYARFANADILKNFCQSLSQNAGRAGQQLRDNGVRYLLLDRSSLEDNKRAQAFMDARLYRDLGEEVIAALEAVPGIRVVRVTPFNEHYNLVEIAGINSLCMDGNGNMVPLTDLNMQTVNFHAQMAGAYTLSFGYDRYLKAFLTEENGTEHLLYIEELDNGNILVNTQDRCGEVTLTYRNPVCTMGFVGEGIVSLVFVGFLAGLYKTGKSKIIEDEP